MKPKITAILQSCYSQPDHYTPHLCCSACVCGNRFEFGDVVHRRFVLGPPHHPLQAATTTGNDGVTIDFIPLRNAWSRLSNDRPCWFLCSTCPPACHIVPCGDQSWTQTPPATFTDQKGCFVRWCCVADSIGIRSQVYSHIQHLSTYAMYSHM